jgi:hypothetical protein
VPHTDNGHVTALAPDTEPARPEQAGEPPESPATEG